MNLRAIILFAVLALSGAAAVINGPMVPAPVVGTSYANNGGTGNRTSIITVDQTGSSGAVLNGGTAANNLVNGTTGSGGNYFENISLSGGTFLVRFDFGSGNSVVIDEAKFYQQNTTSHGVWKWQGSADGSSWTDIGSTFTLGGSSTQTITTLSGNATAYRYYRLLAVSGSSSSGPFIYEFEFKISGI